MGEEQHLQGMVVEGVTMVVKLVLGEEIVLLEADMVQYFVIYKKGKS